MIFASKPLRAKATAIVVCFVQCGLLSGAFLGSKSARAAGPPETAGLTARPLAPHAAQPGKTLFTLLSPDETGVRTENRYADPRMWGDRYLEAGVGSIGSGVTIGDYDGDGRPDIFVVSKSDGCRLFRNLGNWKFEDVTDQAGVGDKGDAALVWKQGATFVDVNNDGRLDLYVCRFDAPNLLYINQGAGGGGGGESTRGAGVTFKEMAHAYGLDVRDASGMAAFFDYDRDGWLDVFIQTNLLNITTHSSGQKNYLFHHNRDATFTNVTERAGISGEAQGHSVTCWDYDGDGWPDLYVANDFGVPDKLYRNNRDGTFTDVISSVVPHTTFASMGSDLGDVNNDGYFDFFVADMAATTHEKDQRTASGVRAGVLELSDDSPRVPKYLHNAFYVNTGTGRCLEAAYLAGLAATDWTWAVRFDDLDNDGRVDLFVTNGMNREQSNLDLIARQMKAESAAERMRIMHDSPVLAERNLAFRNLGDLEFQDVSAAWGLDQKGVSFGVAAGDLDGDGDLDLVYVNFQNNVTVLRNDGDSGHRLVVDLRGTVSNRFGVGATVRIETASGIQVRQLVLARGYMSSNEPMVHFGLGNDAAIKRLTVTWPSGQVQSFENVASDQRLMITEPSFAKASEGAPSGLSAVALAKTEQFTEVSQSANLAWLSRDEPVDEVSLQRLLPVRLNRRGPSLAVADLDGDGTADVAIGGTTLVPLRLLRGASGTYSSLTAPASGTEINDGPVLCFDADGDDHPDLLVTKGGNSLPAGSPEYALHLFLNDGHGKFRPAAADALPPLLNNIGATAAADFDRDGRLDLFLGARVLTGDYPAAPASALLANRGGKFEDVTDILAPGLREVGMVTAALWTDVDGDGWLDLLLTQEWGGVKYFHNNQGKGFENRSEPAGFATAGTGWWTSLTAADFNGDGRPDYVVGNVGLNTQYHASPRQPALLFAGDFKGDGSSQLIEGYYEGDKLYPWRTRRDLGAVIPSLLKRYPRNDFYARATLGEIFGDDQLAKAQRFAATELRSGVFLSQPGGTFRFEPLPRLAQIAPIQGTVAGDFDGDGRADIYAVQNSYAPIPAVGRFDGGLSQLLRGDGHGHFTPVPPVESNLVVPGDAKALVMLDLDRDGWPDFLVSRNNGTTLAFHNNGGQSLGGARVAGRNSLRVELRGPAGNAAAIGARITVELADGSTQTAEVYAGSGYYSQSTAACFFGYPAGASPKRIRVRWPSGASSDHEVAPGSRAIVLSVSP